MILSQSFDLLPCNIYGPYGKSIYDCKFNFLTIVDDFSRFPWIYLLTNKLDAPMKIQQFVNLVKTQFGKVIKVMTTDNAKELGMTQFLQDQGTIHQYVCPYRPEQNSVVERKHHHFLM